MENTKELISLIIPVYNVENYVEKCLESACNQTYGNYEIILINDGSTDDSGKICQKWAAEFPNIRYYEQENQGLGETRNRGIQYALGAYVAFMDSDDWIEEDYLESLYSKRAETEADVAIATKFFQYDEKEKISYTVIAAQELNRLAATTYCLPSMCWKLFRKSLFLDNQIYFSRLPYEDTAVLPLLLLKANKVAYLEKEIYHYRVNTGKSITNNVDNVFKYADTLTELVENSKRVEIFSKNEEIIGNICMIHLASGAGVGKNNFPQEKYLKLLDVYNTFLEKYFPKWQQNSKNNFWIWGSYNLSRIMAYKSWDYNLIKKDLEYFFGFSSIISLMDERQGEIQVPRHKNVFRQAILQKEIQKDFLKIVPGKEDYLLVDFLEERYNLIDIENRFITKSEALDESDFFQTHDKNILEINIHERLELWKKACVAFCENIKQKFQEDHIILFEIYLSKRYRLWDREIGFTDYNIDNINRELKRYYDYFKEQLSQTRVVQIPEEYYYTDGNSKYGYGPWYLNHFLHQMLSQKVQEIINFSVEAASRNSLLSEINSIQN